MNSTSMKSPKHEAGQNEHLQISYYIFYILQEINSNKKVTVKL